MAGATLQVAGCSSDQTSGLASSFKDKMKLVSVIFSDLSIAIFVQEYFNFYTLRLDFATFQEKKHGSGDGSVPEQKTVMVDVGGKTKRPGGGKASSKSVQTANLVKKIKILDGITAPIR